MRRKSRNTQMFALRGVPPRTLWLAGAPYCLARVFKHDFFAATCLYKADAGAPAPAIPKIVVKLGRTQPFLGLPMTWLGRLLRDREQAVYRALAGIRGIPRWVTRVGPAGCAIEYIEGAPLDHVEAPPAGFFDQLREIFDAVHARGIAYADANKRSNILIGPDGRCFLIDYQIALRCRDDLPWPFRGLVAAAVRYVAKRDLYHLYKHKRRISPHELTPQEEVLSRQRAGLHWLHRKLTKPWRAFRRRFLRAQHQAGQLHSPTADLEDHRQPEKDTWREPKA